MSTLDDAREGMDPDIRPQDDLFGHVNGRWLQTAEIPADKSPSEIKRIRAPAARTSLISFL